YDFVFGGLENIPDGENGGEPNQHRSQGDEGEQRHECRMKHDHSRTVLEVMAKRTLPSFLRNLHPAHLAALLAEITVHTEHYSNDACQCWLAPRPYRVASTNTQSVMN